MHIKRKTCEIRTRKKKHLLHQHWYTCLIALPVRRNPQHRSLVTVVSATSHLHFNLFVISETFATQLWTALHDKHHRKQETFLYEYALHCILSPKKTHNRTLFFGSIPLQHVRHFDCWNQTLNTLMLIFYLDCQEAGLCCYLVIHTENLIRPSELFYFHLWPIYWTSACVGFEVLTAFVMESTFFWDVTPCSALSVNRRFVGTYRLHIQWRWRRCSSETPVNFQRATRRYIPEDSTFHTVYGFLSVLIYLTFPSLSTLMP
jgi:hypothetical protein